MTSLTTSSVNKIGVLLAIAGFGVLSGCDSSESGPQRVPVHGKVMVNGEPVNTGSITFTPVASGLMAGTAISNGQYSIAEKEGPVIGNQRVEIRVRGFTGKQIPASPAMPGTTSEMIDEIKNIAPPKYNLESEITREIQAGDNTHDFDLEIEGLPEDWNRT